MLGRHFECREGPGDEVGVVRDRSLFSGGAGLPAASFGGRVTIFLTQIWGGGHFVFNLDLEEGYEFLSLYIFSKSQKIFQESLSERFLSFTQIGTLVLQTRRLLIFIGDSTIVYIAALAHFVSGNPGT